LGYVTFDVRCRSLTFDADNPIAAKLEITAYLTATEKAAKEQGICPARTGNLNQL
jgi:hypothetical protein